MGKRSSDLRQPMLNRTRPAPTRGEVVKGEGMDQTVPECRGPHFRPGRAGKSNVTGYLPPKVKRQLRLLAAEQDTTIQNLLAIAGGGNPLPFGDQPRLLLAWVSTEAVRTKSRELMLGRSLPEFMRKLDIYSSSGGATGGRTRLRNQMKRLLRCTVSLVYEDEQRDTGVSSLVADRTEFWWNPKRRDAPALWDSKIRLGEDFFNEIVQPPVPVVDAAPNRMTLLTG